MIFRKEEIGDERLFFEVSKNSPWLTNISEITDDKGKVKLVSPVFFSVGVKKVDEQLWIVGKLSFELLEPCSRCLKPAQSKIKHNIDAFIPLPEKENIIDVSDDMKEQVAIAMPERLICKGNCKGLCSDCGADLNEKPCACPKQKMDSKFEVLKQLNLS